MNTDAWKSLIATHQTPSRSRAIWQIVDSVGAYLAVWVAMAFVVDISWWLVAPLVLLAGGLLVRVFIIFHDCGHRSFFKSRRANDWVGTITGILAFTPYDQWRAEHATHHGSTGNLDRRGVGDVWTMTVEEYLGASWKKRVAYRIFRSPLVLLGVAPLVMFAFDHRFADKGANAAERRSVLITNLGLLVMTIGMSFVFGFVTFVVLQLAVLAIAGAVGVWLFYAQHQFDGAYWSRDEEWNFSTAALQGSSFLKLPRVLQWFTGNIGFHHVHHLSSRIPNYNLEACHEELSRTHEIEPLTLLRSLRAFRLKLWDEASGKLIRFRQLKTRTAV